METPAILLYEFSPGEVVELKALLPAVRLIPVPRAGYGLTLSEILAEKAPPALAVGTPLSCKMLVLANANGPLAHFLLDACAQVTGTRKVLRAMLTDTNRAWTGATLHEHLLEEEAALSRS